MRENLCTIHLIHPMQGYEIGKSKQLKILASDIIIWNILLQEEVAAGNCSKLVNVWM